MAYPFFIPEAEEPRATAENSRDPLRMPNSQSELPFDQEALIQAFYAALCRASDLAMSPQTPPFSSFNQEQIFFPRHATLSASTSAYSSPRHSFRVSPRRSISNRSRYSQDSDSENEHDEWTEWQNSFHQRDRLQESSNSVPQHRNQNTEPAQPKSKVRSFVISALQYVIDTLKK